MTEPRSYLIRLDDEPNEPPIHMGQSEFDLFLDLGARQPANYSVGEPFATIETSDDGPFLHHGKPIDEDTAADLAGRALNAALLSALERYRFDDPEPEDSTE